MRTPAAQGGAGLRPTVFTYTAAMRAALAGNLIDRALKVSIALPTSVLLCTPALSWALQHRVNGAAPVCTTTMAHHDCRRLHGDRLHSRGAQVLEGFHVMRLTDCDGGLHAVYMCCLMAQVWEDAVAAGCDPDSRMCTTLLEVCTRKGDTKRALGMYERMRDAPAGSRLSPSVHAFVSAMRAAADSGAWEKRCPSGTTWWLPTASRQGRACAQGPAAPLHGSACLLATFGCLYPYISRGLLAFMPRLLRALRLLFQAFILMLPSLDRQSRSV